jgi:DNA polymerase I
VVRLFGKTKKGKIACAFYRGHQPYFYILTKNPDEVVNILNKKFSQLVTKVKETEKFLPLGFQKNRTKLLKIFLKDPSRVPSIREELRSKNFVQDIFEADILFKHRFMADLNVSGMKWYKIKGRGINTTTVKSSKTIEIESIKELEDTSNADLKYMGIDIEVVPGKEGLPDPKKDQIAIISFGFSPDFNGKNSLVLVSKPIRKVDRDLAVFKNEKEMLEEFVKIINSFDPDVITGYNINNFDLPFIIERLIQNRVSRNLGRCNQKPATSRKIGTMFRNSIPERVIADVYDIIKESARRGLLRLKRYGLGDVSKKLLNEDKVNIVHSDISKYWNGNKDQLKKLVSYARKDAILALRLLLEKSMLDKFIELTKVSGLLLQDVLNGGEATRVENLLLKEFNKKDYVIPCRPSSKEILKRKEERITKGLKGALVLKPEVDLHTNPVVYLDFKSMYPSIFIAYNICPTTLVLSEENLETKKTPYGTEFVSKSIKKGILPGIVEQLIKDRDRVKKEMSKAKTEEERKSLDAKQYALKIMANAFYGYNGYLRAKLYILGIANAITSCGRELIQKTRDIVETDKRFKVIYGDTDSVMVKTQVDDIEKAFELGKELEEKINKELKGVVKLKTEGIFKTLLILTKKRYAGLSVEKTNGKLEEKILMKGIETVRRDWCELTSKTLFTVLNILLKDQDPKKAYNYVKEVLAKLGENQIPIEDLVVSKSISKPLKKYKGIQPHVELLKKLVKRSPATAPGVGDRIGFVIVKGLRLMSDRAEDPEYVKKHGLKIDSKYYVESQVLPPLERVFEAMGISKSELIGIGRQLSLADIIGKKKEKPKKIVLNSIDGFICSRCDKTFRRVPLIGKCECGGEILFYSGDVKSREASL